jgi:hypothetical protein
MSSTATDEQAPWQARASDAAPGDPTRALAALLIRLAADKLRHDQNDPPAA